MQNNFLIYEEKWLYVHLFYFIFWSTFGYKRAEQDELWLFKGSDAAGLQILAVWLDSACYIGYGNIA